MLPFVRHTLSRVRLAPVSICAILLLASGGAFAQCAAMMHTAHSPGWGTTVSSLSSPPLSVTFNYNVDAASLNTTINTGNVRLYEFNTGVQVPITASVSGKTVHIKPVSALKPNTLYRYLVRPGIRAVPQSCGTPVYNTSHGNNWYTGHACGGPDVIYTPMTLLRGCTYSLQYRNDYMLNVNADALTASVTLGTFNYTRGADTSLSGRPYTNVVPDMYDFGIGVKMTDIYFDTARNQWIAKTVTVSGFNDNGSGGNFTPLLNTYTNVPVAASNGAFPFKFSAYNIIYGSGKQDLSHLYTPGYVGAVGQISAQGAPIQPPSCTAGTFNFINSALTLQKACKYDIDYSNDYLLNVNADGLTEKVTLGQFAYTRGADTGLTGYPYTNVVPDMYDFGLRVRMSGVRFDAARNQWIATTVTVTGYNDNGSGQTTTPLLNTYSNVVVAPGTGAFPFKLTVYNIVYGSGQQDLSHLYTPAQVGAQGVATASPL